MTDFIKVFCNSFDLFKIFTSSNNGGIIKGITLRIQKVFNNVRFAGGRSELDQVKSNVSKAFQPLSKAPRGEFEGARSVVMQFLQKDRPAGRNAKAYGDNIYIFEGYGEKNFDIIGFTPIPDAVTGLTERIYNE